MALQQAIAADPAFLPAHHRLVHTLTRRGEQVRLRALYAHPRSATGRCIQTLVNTPGGYRVAALELLESVDLSGAEPCVLMLRAMLSPQLRPRLETRVILEFTARALALEPDLVDLVLWHTGTLRELGRLNEADALLQARLRSARHAYEQMVLLSALRSMARARGDLAGATFYLKRMRELGLQDGRPAIQIHSTDLWQEPPAVRHAALRRQAGLAREAGSFSQEIAALAYLGNTALDAGDTRGALQDLNTAVAVAERAGSSGLLMLTLRLRGRAQQKSGNLRQARADLNRAIALHPQVQDDYELAEVYHNLAHTEESAHNMVAAARAADRFIELTRPLRHAQPKVMSLHDAAEIRWKAGWHASAASTLDEMVRVIDAQQWNHYWAGEHFERRGELQRAKEYFAAGVRSGADVTLNYAGLARVYSALGQADSADVAAREHDARPTNQVDVPLRPQVLMRTGRPNEALRIARLWADAKLEQKNVQGAALALNALAELHLSANRPDEALAAANQARSLAQQLNLSSELANAARLEGVSLLRKNQMAAALPLLRLAVARSVSVDARRLALIALGDAYSAADRIDQALEQYRLAAAQVDTVTFGLSHDHTRARYRAGQREAFDRAFSLLLKSGAPMPRLIEWSQRRKGALLSRVTLTLPQLQARLQPGEVLIDYIALDGAVAALRITAREAQLVRLSLSLAQLERLVARVREPMLRVHAGRVDLVRARFDGEAAHLLYRGLLQPLLSGSETKLTIVPDGIIHGVVFDALISERTALPRYLIDHLVIRQSPSLAVVDAERSLPGAASVLAVSYDAPGAAEELHGLQSLFSSARLTVLSGAAATKEAVQAARRQRDVIHFASHARADESDPLGSHLRLARSRHSDGFLHVSEIQAQRADNRLVVLSGCETQGGPLYPGEGVMGVARAFLASGARSVVATTWPIGPQTSVLMQHFYRELLQGRPPSAALRTAKLALRNAPETAHPFFWASYLVISRE